MDDYGSNDEAIPNMDENYGTLMEFLTDNPEMKKAAVHSLRQGLMAGGGAVVGGLILGPVGGLVGGIAGSLMGYLHRPITKAWFRTFDIWNRVDRNIYYHRSKLY